MAGLPKPAGAQEIIARMPVSRRGQILTSLSSLTVSQRNPTRKQKSFGSTGRKCLALITIGADVCKVIMRRQTLIFLCRKILLFLLRRQSATKNYTRKNSD